MDRPIAPCVDQYGARIEVGDTIIFSIGSGGTMNAHQVARGKVEGKRPAKAQGYGYWTEPLNVRADNGRLYIVNFPDNCIKA